jgi:hypothetical protein
VPPLCGNGTLDSNEACDQGKGNGTTASCCRSDCQLVPLGTTCREAASDCDVAEVCSGTEPTCPPDAFAAAGSSCNVGDGDLCDESCDGAGTCAAVALVCDDMSAATADACFAQSGCAHLGLDSGSDTMLQGNTGGGTLYPDACPPGQVLVGFNAEVGASFDKIQMVCGTLVLGDNTAVTLSAGATLPMHGNTSGTPAGSMCPVNQMVVGFEGRAGGLIDQLTLRCAPLVLTMGGTGYSAAPGTVTKGNTVGGSGGTAFGPIDCAAGGVAVGANVRAGNSIDAFGLRCGNPKVN